MKIVILGCGRVGSRLALLMAEDGHQVSVIDADSNALNRLPSSFHGQVVLGTGIDVDVLRTAGIETADAFAAVTNYDNTNIMASQVAKEIFGVEKVLARIYDPGRENLYHQLGLETICPTTLISTAAHDILLTPSNAQTGPLRVDTTKDVVAMAAVLADANANFDRDHSHDGNVEPHSAYGRQSAEATDPTTAQYVAGAGTGPTNTGTGTTMTNGIADLQDQPAASNQAGDKDAQANRGLRGLFKH